MSAKTEAAVVMAVPTNWLDPLLTGPSRVIGNPPYGCRDIEMLLLAIRERVRAAHAKATKKERK